MTYPLLAGTRAVVVPLWWWLWHTCWAACHSVHGTACSVLGRAGQWAQDWGLLGASWASLTAPRAHASTAVAAARLGLTAHAEHMFYGCTDEEQRRVAGPLLRALAQQRNNSVYQVQETMNRLASSAIKLARSADIQDALWTATEAGNESMVLILTTHEPGLVTDLWLHFACERGNVMAVDVGLIHGLVPDICHLYAACRSGAVDIVESVYETLTNGGATPTTQSSYGIVEDIDGAIWRHVAQGGSKAVAEAVHSYDIASVTDEHATLALSYGHLGLATWMLDVVG
jgi:hypothetical protein